MPKPHPQRQYHQAAAAAISSVRRELNSAQERHGTAGGLRYIRPPALEGAPAFELSTPMLVMPFLTFKAQKRIFKSTKQWRDKALADGALLRFAWAEGGTGKVVGGVLDGRIFVAAGVVAIFVSHTWWDRAFKDETNDPSDKYDQGAPDWQSGAKKDLKWRLICQGVRTLVAQEQKRGVKLKLKEVALWIDWQSIYQDDKAEKLKGVMSLIKVCPVPPHPVTL